MNLSRWSLRNRSLVLFFMIVAIAAGVSSFFSLGRDEDPPFTIRTMVVQAAWPGATIEDTLLQLTERLERQLQEVSDLDFLQSYTNAGLTVIFVNLRQDSAAGDIPLRWQQVRNSIGDIRHTLPQGVVGPFFNDDFGDTFGIIYGFTADGFSHRELRDYVESARSRLLNVPDVEKIDIIGAQDERIFVEFSLEKLAGLGLDRAALIAALQAQNLVRPSGVVHTGDERVAIRVSGAFRSDQDVRDVNFVAGGRILRLGDIAEVTRGFADPPQPMFRVNGVPAIGLAIAMREGGDVLALGANVAKEMAAITADLPLGIEPHLVADQPQIVDEAVGEFMESLWQSIVIILVVSFISLGLRAGSIVGISIPLILAIVFPIMGIAGIDMQRISLGALIIALALMVDDAMTTIDAIMRRRAAGDDMEAAAGYAFSHFAVPMLIGTLVTIAGFVPIGFAQSSAGEYTFSLFAVVTIALLVSWVVALLFTPILGAAVLPATMAKEEGGPGLVMRLYNGLLSGAMRAWWLTIPLTLVIFAASVYGLRFVSSQFFPASDRLELLVDVGLPQNASIYATEAAIDRFEAILAEDPDVARWSSYIGQGAIRFYLPLDVKLPNPFFAQLVVIAKDFEARQRLQPRLQQILTDQFPEVISGVSPLELGPPAGWPVQYRVSGPDVEQVRSIALRVADVVAANPTSRRVNFDWFEPSRQLSIDVDQDEARLLGLSSSTVAQALDSAISGSRVTQVRDDIYLIDVVTRATAEERVAIATLRSLQVPGPGGRAIPLTQFATIEAGQEYQQIWRRDRVPTLTVQANVAPGVLPDTVVSALEEPIAALAAGLPPDYHVALGGIAEESADSQASVFAVVPIMLLLMFTLLMVQLRSFQRLFILLSVVPLGLIGVVGALLVSNRPLGFVAILGILALMGMIAKNAVILIEQIESDRKEGKNVYDAVFAAASSRFRPIMLTALSTVLAMIPIAFTVFWGPMAVAIMGGLFVATLLTLVFLPTLYYAWFRREDAARRPTAGGAAGVSVAVLALVLAFAPSPALGEEVDEVLEEAVVPVSPGSRFVGDAGFAWQGESDLDDDDGEVQVNRYDFGLAGRTDLQESLRWNNSFFFGVHDYDFDGPGFGGGPWETILNMRLGTRLSYAIDEHWGISGGGVFIFSPETGADWGDSFTGGGILGAEYRSGKTLFVSLGLAVISQIEDDATVAPAVGLNWLPYEKWAVRLGAVPASGGTSTAAEVAYRVVDSVELGLAVLYNERRFRLDDSGVAPDGVGEDNTLPVRLRVSWNITPQIALHFLGGVVTGGELRLENENGNRLATEDYDAAPYLGLRLLGRF